jgi:hypothetical protein
MRSFIVQSILLALLVIPVVAAREGSAARGLKKAVLLWLVFMSVYALALLYIFPRVT